MSKILLKNIRELITMNQKRERFKGYDLLIEDKQIAKIAENIEIEAEKVIDADDYFVFPGLINTHHHFYQTLTRNLEEVQNLELFEWLQRLYPVWANISPEAVYYSTLVAGGELLKTGCTTTSDQFYVFPDSQPDNLLDHQYRAAEEIGIRFHGARGSMSLSREEGGLPPKNVVQTSQEILKDCRRLIEKFHDDSPYSMQRVVLAPCSPFSVTEDLMRESLKLARSYGVQSHTHVAETKDEEQYCLDNFGLSPLAYMEKLGWVGDDIWYAHGVHFSQEELTRMAAAGTGIAHCPVSNQKLASGTANIPYMLKQELPVGLAVDGSASNDSSNMILEMKAAFLLHRLHHGLRSISAEDVLYLATNGGSRVLNQPRLGSLEEGQAADLFMVNSQRLGFTGGLSDPVSALINTGDTQIVDITIVNGEVVVKEGELVNIEENRIIEEANRISRQMIKS